MGRVVQETSVEALREIAPTLGARQQHVLDFLRAYARTQTWPTAYELFEAMRLDGQAKDLNDVRPRLTELKGKGQIVAKGKRTCRVTGKRAIAWAPVYPSRLF